MNGALVFLLISKVASALWLPEEKKKNKKVNCYIRAILQKSPNGGNYSGKERISLPQNEVGLRSNRPLDERRLKRKRGWGRR